MKNKKTKYPPFFEWAEDGLEFIYQKARKTKNRIIKRYQNKRAKSKKLIQKAERDDADALVATYLMKKKETLNRKTIEKRLKSIKMKSNRTKEKTR